MSDMVWKFCGNPVSQSQLELIEELVEDYGNFSRTELAATVCEVLGWLRPNRNPKTVECADFLSTLHEAGVIELPASRQGRVKGSKNIVRRTRKGDAEAVLQTTLEAVTPLEFHRMNRGDRRLEIWKEYIDRFHYLGYKVPFGAQIRYLVTTPALDGRPLACLQFSSPAWRLKDRDAWIGWSDERRQANLQSIVQNSRFLILPWVRIPHLASHVLSLALKRVARDWEETFAVKPLLVETFVDERFEGACYKAANWLRLGQTQGRGRMDRYHEQAAGTKSLWIFPLCKNPQSALKQ